MCSNNNYRTWMGSRQTTYLVYWDALDLYLDKVLQNFITVVCNFQFLNSLFSKLGCSRPIRIIGRSFILHVQPVASAEDFLLLATDKWYLLFLFYYSSCFLFTSGGIFYSNSLFWNCLLKVYCSSLVSFIYRFIFLYIFAFNYHVCLVVICSSRVAIDFRLYYSFIHPLLINIVEKNIL